MISQQSFDAVTAMFQRVSGIQLGESKRALVTGRLQKLAQARGLHSVDRYVEALLRENDPEELVRVVDKLTTNETYFFREPEHFDFLAELLESRPRGARKFRVWSAASSSGEEAYSIAMVLADRLGPSGWEVVGTDLSTAMVDTARRALYTMERARNVPLPYLKRFCRKGHGEYEGQLLVARELREQVHFTQANLMQTLPDLGRFDLIFLRNVLIYFDPASKEAIARRVLELLEPGGFLFTGHAESLASTQLRLRTVKPAVYART